jgi:hypothetical protein
LHSGKDLETKSIFKETEKAGSEMALPFYLRAPVRARSLGGRSDSASYPILHKSLTLTRSFSNPQLFHEFI